MSEAIEKEGDDGKTLPPDTVMETSAFTGQTLRRRDPKSQRPIAKETPAELVARKAKPLHVFTEAELARIEAGEITREALLEELALEPAQLAETPNDPPETSALQAKPRAQTVEAAAPETLEDLSHAFIEFAIEYIGRDYPGVKPCVLFPDRGAGRPLIFVPVARAGKFGAVFDVRIVPPDMDAGTASRLRAVFSDELRRMQQLGYWCAVANGDAHACDLLTKYLQYEETARA